MKQAKNKMSLYSNFLVCLGLFWTAVIFMGALNALPQTTVNLECGSCSSPSIFAIGSGADLDHQFQDKLNRWDLIVDQITKQNPLFDRGGDRLKAYLYDAQKNVANEESIDSVSLHVIQLFYPDYQRENTHLIPSIDNRFKEERARIRPIIMLKKEEAWQGEIPYHGLEIPSWKPWFLKSVDQFRLPPPPSPSATFWQNQLAQVKQSMKQATESQKQRIVFWAGHSPPGSGDWLVILKQYMQAAHLPPSIQLKVRDAVAKVIVDATIAVFDTKYTYLVKRPNMLDPSLKTYIHTPNHPSFPSAHSTVSAAVVELLNCYFPENQVEWNRLLEEAGMSRIWAGIHFPIDHEAGKILGKKVGQAFLNHNRVFEGN